MVQEQTLQLVTTAAPRSDPAPAQDTADAFLFVNGRIFENAVDKTKKNWHSPRLSKIRLDTEWDAIAFIMLDMSLQPIAIYKATRKVVLEALTKPGSTARNVRGTLSISKLLSTGTKVWPKE